MSDLLFWFLVSQTLTGLPQLAPGTEVRLVSADLLTVFASARVENGRLAFDAPVRSGQEVRILIFTPDATDQERAQVLAGAQAFPGRISEDASDIFVTFPDLDGPLSFGKWLAEERDIELILPGSAGGGER